MYIIIAEHTAVLSYYRYYCNYLFLFAHIHVMIAAMKSDSIK